MQDLLIMNKLPLPRYYDGHEWNTVLRPKRSSIPKYLHQQLPQLKHLYIKRLFQQIGKFNCPGIEYFNGLIKMKRGKTTPRRNRLKQKEREVKEKLQYALITTDRDSNIMDELVEEAKSTQVLRGKRSKQQSLTNKTQLLKAGNKHFDNTMDLVFRNRKNMLINLKEPIENEKQKEVLEKIRKIPLLPYMNIHHDK